jgi:hypothetical protein
MYLGNNAALLGCQEYFNRCAAAGSPIGATQTPTAYDNAASFNGTNQFLSVASNSTLQSGGQAFSFSVWFNSGTTSSNKTFISKIGLNNFEYQIGLNNSGCPRFNLGNAGTSWVTTFNTSTPVVVNTWNHAVFAYDGTSNITVYLNGVSIGSASTSITTSGTNAFNIGYAGAYGEEWLGALSSIGFWKKALTASEVTALFNSGAGRTYASLDSGLRTNLISWWALNQNSVTADSHGTNTLTNNGTVTAPNIGPVVTALSDPRQLIIDFAQGIDRLGLWNSMVCWPLRSSQNAASGTTAFSLGGLGRFDGTLVGSPSRGANGMTFLLASAQGISATVGNLTLAEQSLFAVSRTPVINAGQLLIARNSTGGSQNGMNLRTNEATAIAGGIGDIGVVQQAGGSTLLNIINSKDTNFSGYAVASNITNARLKRFPSTESADTALAFTGNLTNTDPLWIGRRNGAGGTGDCTIPFASMFTRDIRSSWDQVYALYRQTLGLGLGLP